MTPKYVGQIVRINLENFMSYDSIEIYPGNHLNLIIGPNGTGKSSIVCAVLLGLGGKLKTLGRADQLGSYVKSGCDQCCIEIELFQPKGKNVVIKRKILINNQSEFIINGKVSNAAKVNEIRRNFNIQIDNLCTFLPQEKVQDFAKLNPQQLLDQTQRTVGNGDLVQIHEELKRLQSQTIEQENHNKLLENELENEKQKNDRLKDKIKCFKEKQSLSEKVMEISKLVIQNVFPAKGRENKLKVKRNKPIEVEIEFDELDSLPMLFISFSLQHLKIGMLNVLNQKRAWLTYDEEVKDKESISKDYSLAEQVVNSKKEEIEVFNKILQKLENDMQCHKKSLIEAKKQEAGKKEVLEEWVKRAERRIDKLEDLRNALQIKLNDEEEKKREILKYKGNIEKLTNDLRTLNSTLGTESDLNSEKEKVDRQLKDIHDEEGNLNQLKVDLEEDEDTLSQELRNTNRECERLEKRRNIRLEYLKRNEPDVYRSTEWLEKNRHLFQSRIYNPMLLELDVPNSKMAKYVEALVGYKDLISFTCTNPDDLNLLIKKLRTEQNLKVNAICSDEYDSSQYLPAIPINELRNYGFHSYVKDLLTGPEDIIRFLCKTYGVHSVPVGDERVKANCGRIPQSISFFYSENEVFSVKYSVYSGEKSISVKKLDEPKYFAESLDEGRIQILLDRKKDLQNKVKHKQEEIKEVNDKISKLRVTLEQVKKRKRELGTFAEEQQQIQRNLNRAIASYNSLKEALREPEEIEKEVETQRETLKREIQRSLEELKRASEDLGRSELHRQTCELKYKINNFEKNHVLESKAHCTEELSRKQSLLSEVKERLQTAEYKCMQLKLKAKQLTENISREERNFRKFQVKFAELPDTLDEIESEILDTQTKCEFLQGGNYQILQDYEKREERIAHLTSTLENAKRSLEEKKQELNLKQDQWLNPVNELVSNINLNFGSFFEAMGCAGEICLISGENKSDFDQYGIKILVKFRDGTPLQELGRYFQSGGERAVATAIFMLSMQELTSVPFRFVDEINQGMDPENERRILQLIIRVTASEQSTQYFFITPKLLPDLECSRTMTTLCIYNGPHAIPALEWDMKKFLDDKGHSEKEDDDLEEEY